MGLFDRLKGYYTHMLFIEGDEFERALPTMLGNVPDATSSNAHNKEMEMFLYKLFAKNTGRIAGEGLRLFTEFIEKGYPLAQELNVATQDSAFGKIVTAQQVLDNPFATEEQKTNNGLIMRLGFSDFIRDVKKVNSKATSNDSLLGELEEMNSIGIPELDPKYLSPEEGQHFNKEIAPFFGRLQYRVDDKSSGLPTPLAKKSLEFLEAFAKAGYPSAQEMMGLIAYNSDDKKALNHWAKQVEKNPFSTEEQKKNARDDVKDTQAFVAQTQARGGR
ncbi:MAG: hypothetical protein E7021_03490 [Alphaproteobacteria bacterium]|nr:hypothetical protein [Alphaproteobacteria bacterium]